MEKDSAQGNWSSEGEWLLCKHNDCHYHIRNKGRKRRILARIYNDRVELKCDSCGQKSTFKFTKDANLDEQKWMPLESMIEDWESARKKL